MFNISRTANSSQNELMHNERRFANSPFVYVAVSASNQYGDAMSQFKNISTNGKLINVYNNTADISNNQS